MQLRMHLRNASLSRLSKRATSMVKSKVKTLIHKFEPASVISQQHIIKTCSIDGAIKGPQEGIPVCETDTDRRDPLFDDLMEHSKQLINDDYDENYFIRVDSSSQDTHALHSENTSAVAPIIIEDTNAFADTRPENIDTVEPSILPTILDQPNALDSVAWNFLQESGTITLERLAHSQQNLAPTSFSDPKCDLAAWLLWEHATEITLEQLAFSLRSAIARTLSDPDLPLTAGVEEPVMSQSWQYAVRILSRKVMAKNITIRQLAECLSNCIPLPIVGRDPGSCPYTSCVPVRDIDDCLTHARSQDEIMTPSDSTNSSKANTCDHIIWTLPASQSKITLEHLAHAHCRREKMSYRKRSKSPIATVSDSSSKYDDPIWNPGCTTEQQLAKAHARHASNSSGNSSGAPGDWNILIHEIDKREGKERARAAKKETRAAKKKARSAEKEARVAASKKIYTQALQDQAYEILWQEMIASRSHNDGTSHTNTALNCTASNDPLELPSIPNHLSKVVVIKHSAPVLGRISNRFHRPALSSTLRRLFRKQKPKVDPVQMNLQEQATEIVWQNVNASQANGRSFGNATLSKDAGKTRLEHSLALPHLLSSIVGYPEPGMKEDVRKAKLRYVRQGTIAADREERESRRHAALDLAAGIDTRPTIPVVQSSLENFFDYPKPDTRDDIRKAKLEIVWKETIAAEKEEHSRQQDAIVRAVGNDTRPMVPVIQSSSQIFDYPQPDMKENARKAKINIVWKETIAAENEERSSRQAVLQEEADAFTVEPSLPMMKSKSHSGEQSLENVWQEMMATQSLVHSCDMLNQTFVNRNSLNCDLRHALPMQKDSAVVFAYPRTSLRHPSPLRDLKRFLDRWEEEEQDG